MTLAAMGGVDEHGLTHIEVYEASLADMTGDEVIVSGARPGIIFLKPGRLCL